ncbi:hypothetical protein [Cupriavidus sp. Agwp_2]|uniref:hypothetical protein n=1 Tax=Cupriavidus sp. Agwp_2 TaxID=2897324 RepID=UPI003460A170
MEVIQKKGHTIVSPAAIKAFLDEERRLLAIQSPEGTKLREGNRLGLVMSARATDPAESFKGATDAGQTTVCAAILINGGGAVMALVLLGVVMSRTGIPMLGLAGIAAVLAAFSLGVRAAASAFLNRYQSQDAYCDVYSWAASGERPREEQYKRRRMAEEFRDKALADCASAFRRFIVGVWIAFWVLIYLAYALQEVL